MKRKYNNRRSKRRAKVQTTKAGSLKKRLSKRMGGIAGQSLLIENRDQNSFSQTEKNIL